MNHENISVSTVSNTRWHQMEVSYLMQQMKTAKIKKMQSSVDYKVDSFALEKHFSTTADIERLDTSIHIRLQLKGLL